ncbi:hypothetical protein OPKNFCMD_3985 [Methylobacterium crusticola]|uniref:DUF6894 domain-containing protein n=1 Tax=Methylobacterium crusticola TaxID=1697972 RepID=A0ABQ4R0N1_9HYPH|nr:hypothetical protein [Methylobacterium crusticola]GJD51233.1 hypothetical protein OPKNFCMD_3985 [Methylobacterium crusticola]
MTRRFYFDLFNDSTVIRDEEGVEVDDLDEALKQAWFTIEEMRESGELETLAGDWQFAVRDAVGTVLKILSVS